MPPDSAAEPRAAMTRMNYTLDPETLRRLARVVSEVPDVASHSAAIRYLARTWEESRRQLPVDSCKLSDRERGKASPGFTGN